MYRRLALTSYNKLDVAVNYDNKEHLKPCLHHQWYAEQVFKSLDENDDDNAKLYLKMSTLKPIHSNWLISTYFKIALKNDLIKGAFDRVEL